MYFRLYLPIVFITILFSSGISGNDVPRTINYQGQLSDDTGEPVTNTSPGVQMVFTIWNHPYAADLSNRRWTSGPQLVPVEEGIFNYHLGMHVNLPDSIFAKDTLNWLGIKIGTDPEITPRTRLASVPYAYHALRADTAYYSLTPSPACGWSKTSDRVYLSDINDKVGIGTLLPQTQLHLYSSTYQPTIFLESLNPSEIIFGEGTNICGMMFEPSSGIWSLQTGTTGLYMGQDNYIGINRTTSLGEGDVFGVKAPLPVPTAGIVVETEHEQGYPYFGYAADNTLQAQHYFDALDDRWVLSINNSPRLTVTGYDIKASGYNSYLKWNADSSFLGINVEMPLFAHNLFSIKIPEPYGFGGMIIETEYADGRPYYGYATDSAIHTMHYFDGTYEQWTLDVGSSKLTVDKDYKMKLHDSSGDSTIILDADTMGDAAAILPISAINADERLNEPGLEMNSRSSHVYFESSSTMQDIVGLCIEIPTDGYIHVTGRSTGYVYTSHIETLEYSWNWMFQIDEDEGGFWNSGDYVLIGRERDIRAGEQNQTNFSVYVDKIYEKEAGAYVFRLEGLFWNNVGFSEIESAAVYNSTIVATFYPTKYECTPFPEK